MKKMALFTLIATVLSASENPYEVAPMIGYTFPNGGQQIRDHTVFAAEVQFNDIGAFVKPELSLMYGDVDRNDERSGDVDIFRSAVNGVYEFQQYYSQITPFVKAGIGYETMSDHVYDNQNGFFIDGGVGVKIAITQQIAFKLEAIEMQKYNHSDWDNNLVYMAGVAFAFGE
ncbi:MAG TPA: outer membrane beta-barrel protein [Sulfuricurvum sp.]|nr:outer membrane beta-barrel protein [Sulfuricurvum sp.]